MRALAIPRQTLDWLTESGTHIEALSRDLATEVWAGRSYCAIGALRTASDGNVAVLWHRDYAAAASEVDWMVIRLDGNKGLAQADEDLRRIVLSRILRVAHLRFRNLNLPAGYISRSWEGSRYTCLAGRGGKAWQRSIAWIDERLSREKERLRVLGFIGPWRDPGDDAEHQSSALLHQLEQDRDAFLSFAVAVRALREKPEGAAAIDGRWDALRSVEARAEEEPEVDADGWAADLEQVQVKREGLAYREWVGSGSPLTQGQKAALRLAKIGKAPIRIHGPAGSGKSLVMQLLAVRWAEKSLNEDKPDLKVLYLAHNTSAKDFVNARLRELAGSDLIEVVERVVRVETINDLANTHLNPNDLTNLLDKDNSESKEFQLEIVRDLLRQQLNAHEDPSRLPVLGAALGDEVLERQVARSVVADIGYVIKAQLRDRQRDAYVLAETPYSRLHQALNEEERGIVFDVFRAYDRDISQIEGLLDNDDVALSLLQTFTTPLWRNVRRKRGVDLVLVDEAQLYSPTEKMLFQYLCREPEPPHPIVLALDRGQDLDAMNEQGLGTLGIGAVDNIEVYQMKRCSREITRVALDLILQSTDVFDDEFRPFSRDIEETALAHPKNRRPSIARARARTLAKAAIKEARRIRKENLRSVGIVALTSSIVGELAEELKADVLVISDRSTKLPDQPHIALGTPATVGGLEFDGVVVVGCERGLFPPLVSSSEGFQALIDQQCLRELYLAVTRTRYELVFLIPEGAEPSRLLERSIEAGHIEAT